MPATTFTPEEIRETKRLLEKVAADGYWFPDEETTRAFHSTVSMWATELVIFRNDDWFLKVLHWFRIPWKKKGILLAIYDGGMKEFHGKWHIPGGYSIWSELDIQATCFRVAKKEIGAGVRYEETLDSYKWRRGEHPYGRPLSLFVRCEPFEEIRETEKLRFFSKSELPANLIEPHRRFIERFL
jgi:hypothetical protein